MAKTRKKQEEIQLTPEQVAEKANPGWKAVRVAAADAEKQASADAVGADAEQILAKYGQPKSPEVAAAKRAQTAEGTIVRLEPEVRTDRLGPRPVSYVENGKETGRSG